jgi:acyl carrier protein
MPAPHIQVTAAIREKTLALAKRRGVDAPLLGNADNVFESGLLDSADAIELVVWLETTFGLTIPQSDLTVDTLGSIDAMAAYLRRARPQLFT